MDDISHQHLNLDNLSDAINIVLIGQTGSGKSYFANSLLGSMSPGNADNIFSTMESTDRYSFEISNSLRGCPRIAIKNFKNSLCLVKTKTITPIKNIELRGHLVVTNMEV